MRYVIVRHKHYVEEIAYRIYVSDALKGITGNTGRATGGVEMTARFYDALKVASKPVEKRTSEEIIESIRKKLSGGGNNG